MRMHFGIIKSELKKSRNWRNLGNYLIVGSNKWFSDFGQNIWKPLLWLIGFHLILVNIAILTNDQFNLTYGWDREANYEGLKFYFYTLLPTHGGDVKIWNNTISLAGPVDFIMRVASGYFIYYFISASRKYHQ